MIEYVSFSGFSRRSRYRSYCRCGCCCTRLTLDIIFIIVCTRSAKRGFLIVIVSGEERSSLYYILVLTVKQTGPSALLHYTINKTYRTGNTFNSLVNSFFHVRISQWKTKHYVRHIFTFNTLCPFLEIGMHTFSYWNVFSRNYRKIGKTAGATSKACDQHKPNCHNDWYSH